jgi:hypothetical protein
MKYFHEEYPQKGKFVAFFSDGSAAMLFTTLNNSKYGKYQDEDGDYLPDNFDFEDAGYIGWMPLPDNFKLWYGDE